MHFLSWWSLSRAASLGFQGYPFISHPLLACRLYPRPAFPDPSPFCSNDFLWLSYLSSYKSINHCYIDWTLIFETSKGAGQGSQRLYCIWDSEMLSLVFLWQTLSFVVCSVSQCTFNTHRWRGQSVSNTCPEDHTDSGFLHLLTLDLRGCSHRYKDNYNDYCIIVHSIAW